MVQFGPLPQVVVIVGDDAEVGRAMEALLRSSGRRAFFVGPGEAASMVEPVEAADLVLITPIDDPARREELLGRVRSALGSRAATVVSLSQRWARRPEPPP